MNYSPIIFMSTVGVVAATLLLSGCYDDPKSSKAPPQNNSGAVGTTVPGPDRSQDPATPGPVKHGSVSASSPTQHNEADRGAGVRKQGNSIQNDRPVTTDTTDSRTAAQVDRATEEVKGAVGKTEDPVLAERNRQEAVKHPTDDTGRNVRDRNADSLTPVDQSESQADIDITAEIRRKIIAHDSLSVLSKNVKIITKDGMVTLRGPVQNSSEIVTIREIALSARGVRFVDNDLEIAP